MGVMDTAPYNRPAMRKARRFGVIAAIVISIPGAALGIVGYALYCLMVIGYFFLGVLYGYLADVDGEKPNMNRFLTGGLIVGGTTGLVHAFANLFVGWLVWTFDIFSAGSNDFESVALTGLAVGGCLFTLSLALGGLGGMLYASTMPKEKIPENSGS